MDFIFNQLKKHPIVLNLPISPAMYYTEQERILKILNEYTN